MAALPAVTESPHEASLGVILFNSNENYLSYLRRTDGRTNGRTDDGEFNSPPSSLREAGDKNYTDSVVINFNLKVEISMQCSAVGIASQASHASSSLDGISL